MLSRVAPISLLLLLACDTKDTECVITQSRNPCMEQLGLNYTTGVFGSNIPALEYLDLQGYSPQIREEANNLASAAQNAIENAELMIEDYDPEIEKHVRACAEFEVPPPYACVWEVPAGLTDEQIYQRCLDEYSPSFGNAEPFCDVVMARRAQ